METMQELIPFAKEMLSQRPSRSLVKIYLLGSLFAVLGTIVGLVEVVCQPFSSGQSVDAEEMLLLLDRVGAAEAETLRSAGGKGGEEDEEEREKEELARKNEAVTQSVTLSESQSLSHRSMATRLHAS